MNFFEVVFYQPIVNLFYGIYFVSRDVGVATVLMALLIRLVMWPYIKKSYITGQKTRLVQPIIKQIQKAYKGNIIGQQEALKKLYQKYDIKASLSGLIILLQLPIYFALFQLIEYVNKRIPLSNLYSFFGPDQLPINQSAFGLIDISQKLDSNNLLSSASVTVLILSLLTLVFTFLMAKYIFPVSAHAPQNDQSKTKDGVKKDDTIIDSEVFNKTLQFQMTYFMPVVSFIINLNFPAGLNIYFLAGTVFSFVQQYRLAKKYRIDKPQIESDEEIVPMSLLKDADNNKENKKIENIKSTDESKTVTVEPIKPKASKPSKGKAKNKGKK